MPLVDITNPNVIKFLVENYDKTARLRLKWNSHNEVKLKQAATFTTEEKGLYEIDVLKEINVGGMAAIARDHNTSAENRRKTPLRDVAHIPAIGDIRKGHSIPEVGLGSPEEDPRLDQADDDFSFAPIMRPVDSKHREILYKGIPSNGRQVYLSHRNRIKPENKYYFQECSGWVYGWRMKDSAFGRQGGSGLGRVYRLTHGTKSRTGPQPDPHYYQNSDIPGPSKCKM